MNLSSFFAGLKAAERLQDRNQVCGRRVVVDPGSVDFVSHV